MVNATVHPVLPLSIRSVFSKETVQITMLTVELAQELLAANVHNRKSKINEIDRLADAFLLGDGRLTNDAIVVNEKGHLDNGQNRCHAVIKSGIAIPVILLLGTDPDAQDVMDSGVKRRLSDQLSLRGEKNTSALGASISWLARYETGNMRGGGTFGLTVPQSIRFLDQRPALRTTVLRASQVRNRISVAEGLWGALIYIFEAVDADDCEAFLRGVETGIGLDQTDPRYLLREALLREISAARRTPPWRLAAISIKAWNRWREGDPMKQLVFRAGGASPEQFPLAI